MRCALLIVHAQALQCLRTHAVRGMARRAASVDIDAANAKAAAVDLDAANAKAKRVWAEVAVAAPELAPDTRPFGDGVRPFFLAPRAGAVRAPRRTMVFFCYVCEAARDAGSPSSARRLLFPAQPRGWSCSCRFTAQTAPVLDEGS